MIEGEAVRPQLSTACLLPQFSLIEQKFPWVISSVKLMYKWLKSFSYIEINRYLFEAVIYFHKESHAHFLPSESQFISWMLFENIKDGHIKKLKYLTCVWFKSYDAESSVGEKTDHLTGDVTRPIIHQ
jgi:hypothetical protein